MPSPCPRHVFWYVLALGPVPPPALIRPACSQVPAGPHVYRLNITAPVGYHAFVSSATPFSLGDYEVQTWGDYEVQTWGAAPGCEGWEAMPTLLGLQQTPINTQGNPLQHAIPS